MLGKGEDGGKSYSTPIVQYPPALTLYTDGDKESYGHF